MTRFDHSRLINKMIYIRLLPLWTSPIWIQRTRLRLPLPWTFIRVIFQLVLLRRFRLASSPEKNEETLLWVVVNHSTVCYYQMQMCFRPDISVGVVALRSRRRKALSLSGPLGTLANSLQRLSLTPPSLIL